MEAAADRLEFAPPPQPGLMRGMLLALVAHLLLLLALASGALLKTLAARRARAASSTKPLASP